MSTVEILDDSDPSGIEMRDLSGLIYRVHPRTVDAALLRGWSRYREPAPQAQEETRGAPAPVGRDPLRKAVLYILERHYLSVAERGGYTTNQAVEDVVAAFRENPQAPGLDAKNLLDTAKFWIEKGDQEGALQWRFGLVKLAAKARDSLPGNPKIRPQPPAPASPGGREVWWYCANCRGCRPAFRVTGGLLCACGHVIASYQDPAAPEAGAPGTQTRDGHKWWCSKANGGLTCGCAAPPTQTQEGGSQP